MRGPRPHGLVNDGRRAGGRRNRRSLTFEEVLVHPAALTEQPQRGFEAVHDVAPLRVVEAFVVLALEAIDDADVAGLGHEGRVVDERPQREQRIDAAGLVVLPPNRAVRQHSRLLDTHGRVLRRVVARAEARRRQKNPQHLRVTFRRPPCEPVQRRERQQRREERIEQVEHGGAHHQRQKEQAPIDAPDGQGTVQRFVDAMGLAIADHRDT